MARLRGAGSSRLNARRISGLSLISITTLVSPCDADLRYADRVVKKLLVGLLVVAGCTGERVESAVDAGDAGAGDVGAADAGDTGEAGVTDAGCSSVPGNLVQNPSFELASSGVVTGWEVRGTVAQKKGGAAHCDAWAEVTFDPVGTEPVADFGQVIRLDAKAPKGSHVVATMYARTLDADLDGRLAVGILYGDYGRKDVTLPADGTWKQIVYTWDLTEETDALWISFVSTAAAGRRVGVDHVTLVLTPP